MNGLDLPGIYQAAEQVKGQRLQNLLRQRQMQEIEAEQGRQMQLRDLIGQYAQQQTGEIGPETPWEPQRRLGSLLRSAAAIEPGYLGKAEAIESEAAQAETGYRQQQAQREALTRMLQNTPGAEKYADVLGMMSPEDAAKNLFGLVKPQSEGIQRWITVPTSTGWMKMNNITGEVLPIDAGEQSIPGAIATSPQALPVAIDPEAQARVAGAKARAVEEAKQSVGAESELQTVKDKANYTLDLIDAALQHPGRETATGLSGTLDPRSYLPGTQAKDFLVILDQLKGQAFLQAFESLKGGGQITEVEGKKATEAMARLNTAQSDQAFESALRELKTIATQARNRAMLKAGVNRQTATPSGLTPEEQRELDQLRQRFPR